MTLMKPNYWGISRCGGISWYQLKPQSSGRWNIEIEVYRIPEEHLDELFFSSEARDFLLSPIEEGQPK